MPKRIPNGRYIIKCNDIMAIKNNEGAYNHDAFNFALN